MSKVTITARLFRTELAVDVYVVRFAYVTVLYCVAHEGRCMCRALAAGGDQRGPSGQTVCSAAQHDKANITQLQ